MAAANGHLTELAAAIEHDEPRNARVAHRVADMLNKVAWRQPEVLQVALALADRARKAQPSVVDYMALYADLALQLGR